MTKVILPELGEGITKATVSYWYFKVGDKVNEGDDLVEMTTDKATFNVPCPAAGVLSQIITEEGQAVEVGAALAQID